jgi:transposase
LDYRYNAIFKLKRNDEKLIDGRDIKNWEKLRKNKLRGSILKQ